MKLKHIFFLALMTACQSNDDAPEESVIESDKVVLTAKQTSAANIRLGRLLQETITRQVTAVGKLDLPPENMVSISAPSGGFIKSLRLLPGMTVKKGEVLVELENQVYIQLQQDYLLAVSKLKYLDAEYRRQQLLAQENVSAQKTFQQTQAEYTSIQATARALEARLAMLNITPGMLASGNIQSVVKLYAPISGYVGEVNGAVGQYVSETFTLFKIINTQHIHVALDVYEKDINGITPGQTVRVQLQNEQRVREATVYLVGKEIRSDRTVVVHCHLKKNDPDLLPGMFVSGIIEVTAQKVWGVPSTALVNYENARYIFSQEKDGSYHMISVRTGTTTEDFTEILEPVDTSLSIVLDGAYTLLGVLKNKQE